MCHVDLHIDYYTVPKLNYYTLNVLSLNAYTRVQMLQDLDHKSFFLFINHSMLYALLILSEMRWLNDKCSLYITPRSFTWSSRCISTGTLFSWMPLNTGYQSKNLPFTHTLYFRSVKKSSILNISCVKPYELIFSRSLLCRTCRMPSRNQYRRRLFDHHYLTHVSTYLTY